MIVFRIPHLAIGEYWPVGKYIFVTGILTLVKNRAPTQPVPVRASDCQSLAHGNDVRPTQRASHRSSAFHRHSAGTSHMVRWRPLTQDHVASNCRSQCDICWTASVARNVLVIVPPRSTRLSGAVAGNQIVGQPVNYVVSPPMGSPPQWSRREVEKIMHQQRHGRIVCSIHPIGPDILGLAHHPSDDAALFARTLARHHVAHEGKQRGCSVHHRHVQSAIRTGRFTLSITSKSLPFPASFAIIVLSLSPGYRSRTGSDSGEAVLLYSFLLLLFFKFWSVGHRKGPKDEASFTRANANVSPNSPYTLPNTPISATLSSINRLN
jgi:hypothetical protein